MSTGSPICLVAGPSELNACFFKNFTEMSHARSRAARLAMQTLPLGGYALYMIYILYELAEAKNRAGKAFCGPKHCPGMFGRLSAGKAVSRPVASAKGGRSTVAMRGRSGPIDCQSSYSTHLYSVPSTIIAPWLLRCKLRGCYNNDSTGHLCGTVFVWFLELCR